MGKCLYFFILDLRALIYQHLIKNKYIIDLKRGVFF
jgi:hypothetical protein